MVAVAVAHSSVPAGCRTGVAAVVHMVPVEAVHTGVAHMVVAVVVHMAAVRRVAVVVACRVVEVGHKVVVPAESGLDHCTWIKPPNLFRVYLPRRVRQA